MTAITPTEREPQCDIDAQFYAFLDTKHPKRAVWVSLGTPRDTWLKYWMDDVHRLELDAGMLFASEHDCGRLEDDPSEEMLAELLDYTEPKSSIQRRPALWWPVVQARDQGGRVVWEQITSWERLTEALHRGMRYGKIAICTMDEVLARRKRLIAEEERAAAGQ